MRWVGHLVGVHTDQARTGTYEQAAQIVLAKRRLTAQVLIKQRCEQARECGSARQLHFERQALAFMYAVGARRAYRLAQPLAWQVLLKSCMAGFVYRTEQALHEVIFAIARGQTHIFRNAAAERMHTLV